MVRRETRQMNEREAAVLRAAAEWEPGVPLRGTVKWIAIWVACLVALGLIAYGLLLWTPPLIEVGSVLGGVLLVAAIVCTYAIITLLLSHIRWARGAQQFRRTALPAIQAALRDGTVQSITVRATAAATIEQSEDEGDAFIFDIGNGQLLVLNGQEYDPVDDTTPWPNSEFEIVRSTVGNRWIGLFCSRPALKPTTVLQSSDCKEEIIWGHREDVVTASMKEFIRSIRAAG